MATTSSISKFWLLKAEPDSRIVKGKDVKFSVDDFERVETSPWEGVRNYEARNLMKEMKIGDKALFYHSSCKIPGIAAFAEISKEAYPDYTAWDPTHPYFDQKTKPSDPKWFMVDLTFKSKAKHFVPLALLRYIADQTEHQPPEEIAYIGEEGITSLKNMDLVRKGRLSVQRVSQEAWNALSLLAENGGWEEMDLKPAKRKPITKGKGSGDTTSKKSDKPNKCAKRKATKTDDDSSDLTDLEDEDLDGAKDQVDKVQITTSVKRKREDQEAHELVTKAKEAGLRRSSRQRKK